jgi:hypothetical protein
MMTRGLQGGVASWLRPSVRNVRLAVRLRAALALLAAVSSGAFAQSQEAAGEGADARRGAAMTDRLVLEGDALDHLPSTGSLANVVSRVFMPAVSSAEESMGFSDIEPERFTVVGDSALWSTWRLDDFNLTDPLHDGAAAFKVPWLFLSEVELRHAESARHVFGGGVRLGTAPRAGRPARQARVSFGIGGVGGTVPGAEAISSFFTTAHARNRAVQPEEDRRRFLGRLQAGLLDESIVGGFVVRSAIEVDGAVRRHQSFPLADRAQAGMPFDERTLRVSGITEVAPRDRAFRLTALAEYRFRDNLFAERRFSRDETLQQSSGGALVGFAWGAFRAALTFKHEGLAPARPGFSREVLDVDGEGSFPFVPTGAMNSTRLELSHRVHDVYAVSDTRLLAWSGSPARVHPLTFDGSQVGAWALASRPTVTVIGSQRLGYQRTFVWKAFELAVDGYGVVNHASAHGSDGLAFPDVGAEAQGVLTVTPWFQPFLSVGKTPIGVPSQTALTLTPGHLSAVQRTADGRFVQRLGGDVTRVDPRLQGPSLYSASFGFTSRLGRAWKVTLQGIAKAWHGLSRLRFDGEPPGSFDEDGFFFFDGGPTRYRLVNDPFRETPFGGQAQLEIARLPDEHGFFSFGFSAANFFGHAPFGNGAYGNDIGLVDWLGANPNATYRSLSNTDADRAFVLKAIGGRRWFGRLWTTFAVFFKDGQPFGFYDARLKDGQVAFRRNSNRGSAMMIGSPLIGWREDFQVELDVRVSYDVALTAGWTLRASLICANLFDLGNEVSERHGPPFDRSTLELQLPRSLGLTVELLDQPRQSGPAPR